ncbi:MAG: AmmeMemoRadiSam system radical SAM enzyme [Bacteroidetes bacterium]|nr:AmmeMemoRadiSam system radical SAM enzyme [Bacteroidota bacterium]
MVEAKYYHKDGDELVCDLCPRACRLGDGDEGACFGYTHLDGKLIATNYSRVVTAVYDPVEKKPFFHYYPNSVILSIAPNGCNLKCSFCQNHQFTAEKAETKEINLQTILEYSGKSHSIGVAYTFTEPLIWPEYLVDATRKLKGIGQKNILVSNGYVNEKPLRDVLPYVDAINISVKAMRNEVYEKYMEGNADVVLNSIRIAAKETHLEVTYLLIPGLTDSDKDIGDFIDFMVEVNKDIPVHFKRFFPHYKMTDIPMTPNETMVKAYKLANQKLSYIYLIDTDIDGVSDTFCPNCKRLIIKRRDYQANLGGMRGANCKFCGHRINIKF